MVGTGGDPDLMRQEMARLRKRVHKLMWLNPTFGHAGVSAPVFGDEDSTSISGLFFARTQSGEFDSTGANTAVRLEVGGCYGWS